VGDGSFGAATPYLVKGDPADANPSPIAVDLGDFNGDGHLDIAAINQFGEKDSAILINAGDGTFGPLITVPFGVDRATFGRG
jgi:hypothetical protein